MSRADSFRQVGEVDRAIDDFEWAMIGNPSPANRRNLAMTRFLAGRFAAAREDLERSAVDCPKDLPTQCALGLTWFALGKRAEAVFLLEQVLHDNPDKAVVQTSRGWVALLMGDLAMAHRLLNEAAERDGGILMFHANLSQNLWSDPNADWAVAEFADRCRVAPTLPWAVIGRTDTAARRYAIPRPVPERGLRLAVRPGRQRRPIADPANERLLRSTALARGRGPR